ncbi:MAG: hypothetical protein BMS9Abin19_0958 [Gammaproteobacteria bacterium]|nr:MAG: hypothetical protein BMS9Abin19_0958 [Gammaproteobacteria bacterium]
MQVYLKITVSLSATNNFLLLDISPHNRSAHFGLFQLPISNHPVVSKMLVSLARMSETRSQQESFPHFIKYLSDIV